MEESKKPRKPEPPRAVHNDEPFLTCEERRKLYALHPHMGDEVQFSPAFLESLDEAALDALLNKLNEEEEHNG